MLALHLRAGLAHRPDFRAWQMELLFALPIVTLVVYLYSSWFAVRDRYFIFLYFHDMGSGFDTTPFGWVTQGRYWMTGLVASGAVMVLYSAVNVTLGTLVKRWRAPAAPHVWLLSAVPLAIIIPVLVMTVNDPVLPVGNAAQVTSVLLIGLALAVWFGRIAAVRPLDFILLIIDGCGLVCVLMALRTTESFQAWLDRGNVAAIYRFTAMLSVGVAVLMIMTAVYARWRRVRVPHPGSWLLAGASVHYLFLPINHYLFWCTDSGSWTDPDYFTYIPAAANYFSRNVVFQISVWVAVVLIAAGLTRVRVRLRQSLLAREKQS